jgi:hypothetical protein
VKIDFSLFEGGRKKIKVLKGESEYVNLIGRQIKDVNYVLGV